MNPAGGRGALGLKVIAAYKLAKALLLLAAGGGLLGMVDADVSSSLVRWTTALGLDANNHYLRAVIARLADVDRQTLQVLGVGTLCYAAWNIVEGVGLWLRLRWAEYVTIVATALLLPVEAVEIVREPAASRFVVVALSLAIILYLVYRLEVDRPSADGGPTREAGTDPEKLRQGREKYDGMGFQILDEAVIGC